MTDHDRIVKAVGFAGMSVEELQGKIHETREKADEVTLVIVNAVGESPVNPHGRQALEQIIGLKERLDEMIASCESIKEEMNSYSAWWG